MLFNGSRRILRRDGELRPLNVLSRPRTGRGSPDRIRTAAHAALDRTIRTSIVVGDAVGGRPHPVFEAVRETSTSQAAILLDQRRKRAPTMSRFSRASVVARQVDRQFEFETTVANWSSLPGRGGHAPMEALSQRSTGTVLDRSSRCVAHRWPRRDGARDILDGVGPPHRCSTLAKDGLRRRSSAPPRWPGAAGSCSFAGGSRRTRPIQRLAGNCLHLARLRRRRSDQEGDGPQTGGSLGISGDWSHCDSGIGPEHIGIVRELVQAADYWRMKRLVFDIVILNERGSSYSQELQNEIESIVRTSLGRAQFGERPKGGVFVLRADLIPPETRELLLSAARVVLAGQYGRLAGQLQARRASVVHERRRYPRRSTQTPGSPVVRPTGLEYFNGLGGFAKKGREYVIVLGPGQNPGAVDQCSRQSDLRLPGFRKWRGLCLGVNSREHQVIHLVQRSRRNPPARLFRPRRREGSCAAHSVAAP